MHAHVIQNTSYTTDENLQLLNLIQDYIDVVCHVSVTKLHKIRPGRRPGRPCKVLCVLAVISKSMYNTSSSTCVSSSLVSSQRCQNTAAYTPAMNVNSCELTPPLTAAPTCRYMAGGQLERRLFSL